VFWRPAGKPAVVTNTWLGTAVFDGISRKVRSCQAVGMPEQARSSEIRLPTPRTGIIMSEVIDDDANKPLMHGFLTMKLE
jgi:hypothetical protein